MLIELLEYARLSPRRVIVSARLVPPDSLTHDDLEHLAESVIEHLIDVHRDDLIDALKDIAERCIARILSDRRVRRKLIHGILTEAAEEGLISITCSGDTCRAEIDPEKSPEPGDWESSESVAEMLEEMLDESDAADEVFSEIDSCILHAITRAGGTL